MSKWESSNVIRNVAFSPDSQKILTCSDADTVILSDIQGGELIKIERDQRCLDAVFSKAGENIHAAFYREKFKLYDLDGTQLKDWSAQLRMSFLEYSEDGSLLAIVEPPQPKPGRQDVYISSQNIEIFDTESGQRVGKLSTSFDKVVSAIRFSSDNSAAVVTYTSDSSATQFVIFNPRLSKIYSKFEIPDSYSYKAGLSPDKKYIVTANYAAKATVIDALGSEVLFELEHGDEEVLVFDASFSPNGEYIVSSTNDGRVFVWDVNY